MPIKKTARRPAPKRAAKPIAKKSAPATLKIPHAVPAKNTVKPIGLLGWLFVPERPVKIWRWILRSLCFTVAVPLIVSIMSAFSIGIANVAAGLDAASFWQRLTSVWGMYDLMYMMDPAAMITMVVQSGLMLFIFGMFAFMPRRKIGKHAFFGAIVMALLAIGAGAWLINYAAIIESFAMLYSGAAISILAIIMAVAAMVRYAGHLGVSPWKILLSFPFGTMIYTYTGLLLPDAKAEKETTIKWRPFSDFITFMSATRVGIILTAVMTALVLAIYPMPWTIIGAIVFLIIMAVAGVRNVAPKMPKIAWAAMLMNIAIIALLIIAVEFFTADAISVMYGVPPPQPVPVFQ